MLLSNSEVNTFHQCERRHYYAFREALKADGHSKALTRGIVGHEALEAYYKAKQRGMSKQYCEENAQDVLNHAVTDYPEYEKELTQLKPVLTRYVDYYWNEPWKILEVESSYSTLLDNSIEYGMRLDLLVEVTAGRDKGQVLIVDHKFVYDLFTDREKQVNAQLARYAYTLKQNGIDVRKAILNQVRYRQLKSPKPEMVFRRDPVFFADKTQERFMKEFYKTASRIVELYELTEEEHKEKTTMYLDKMSCGSCAYQSLCNLYMQGIDEEKTKKVIYTHNDYLDQYRKE